MYNLGLYLGGILLLSWKVGRYYLSQVLIALVYAVVKQLLCGLAADTWSLWPNFLAQAFRHLHDPKWHLRPDLTNLASKRLSTFFLGKWTFACSLACTFACASSCCFTLRRTFVCPFGNWTFMHTFVAVSVRVFFGGKTFVLLLNILLCQCEDKQESHVLVLFFGTFECAFFYGNSTFACILACTFVYVSSWYWTLGRTFICPFSLVIGLLCTLLWCLSHGSRENFSVVFFDSKK